jgi:uncharacterized membrane protein
MKTLSRLYRHLRTTTAAGKRVFPEQTLKAIEETITEGETRHRAEVHMIVEPALDLQAVLSGMSSRDRATELFSDYCVWDTEENCGVLVYINLADHQVEIVPDRGVGREIPAGEWETVCQMMTQGFARGEYHQSVISALRYLNDLMEQHYPDDGTNQNQLSNKPVML